METVIMKCGACGATYPADAQFCPKCGVKVVPVPPTATPGEATGNKMLHDALNKTAEANRTEVIPETFLWRGGYSAKAMIGGWILSTILTLVFFLVGIFVPAVGILLALVASALVWGWHAALLVYRRLSYEYELSTQRFIHRAGILSRVTNRIEVIDISDVQVAQTFIERFLSLGTIRIYSTDTTDPALVMTGIDDVNRIATLIDDTRRTERRKRSVHIETS
jgi:membrane protein YdbS with pleckstrin-like domain